MFLLLAQKKNWEGVGLSGSEQDREDHPCLWERADRWETMVAYEFYWLDPKGGYQIIGVLPERRKNPARITHESVTRWGRNFFGKDFDTKGIFFIQVTISEKTCRVFRPVPFTIPLTNF